MREELQDIKDKCGASICILDNQRGNQIWYPEEGICTCYRKNIVKVELGLENGSAPKWIKKQHIITKHLTKKGIRQAPYFFTLEMLEQDVRVVRGATKGINPDGDIEAQLDVFLKRVDKSL